eukprot:m.165099 g.165099  ORF g.165099 m.165099 type:complete len:237 (+) comp23978_c0_seq2:699-1409(+)
MRRVRVRSPQCQHARLVHQGLHGFSPRRAQRGRDYPGRQVGPHGPSEEDKNSIADIRLSQSDVTGLTADWLTVMARLSSYASAHKKYIAPTYMGDALSLSANSSTCTAAMKTYCGPNAPSAAPHYFSVAYDKVQPPVFGLSPTNMDLDMAHYLVARGPYGWIGSGKVLGWQLSHWWAPGQTRLVTPLDFRPHWFNVEFGEPLNRCSEPTAGVFTRNWTKADVTVDCRSMAGDIRML